jgi:hypothetical protein
MFTAVLLLVVARRFARQDAAITSRPLPAAAAPLATESTQTKVDQQPTNLEHGFMQEIFQENLDLLDQNVVTNAA